ncbi:MAG: hypothetical protein Q8P67_03805, partial [archaeon]|nr:hypothetical protein [archaeon]
MPAADEEKPKAKRGRKPKVRTEELLGAHAPGILKMTTTAGPKPKSSLHSALPGTFDPSMFSSLSTAPVLPRKKGRPKKIVDAPPPAIVEVCFDNFL